MATQTLQRRLTTILAADVVGYSRMVRNNEELAIEAFREVLNEIITPIIERHGGRIFKLMGDGILAEFPSVVEGMRTAIEIQTTVGTRNTSVPAERQMIFRIGMNLGDVVIDGDDLQGDGVNVAARLEALADTGGICISDSVYQLVRDRVDAAFEGLGERTVKNIDRPVRLWRWIADPQAVTDGEQADTSRDSAGALAISGATSVAASAAGSPADGLDAAHPDVSPDQASPPRWTWVLAGASAMIVTGVLVVSFALPDNQSSERDTVERASAIPLIGARILTAPDTATCQSKILLGGDFTSEIVEPDGNVIVVPRLSAICGMALRNLSRQPQRLQLGGRLLAQAAFGHTPLATGDTVGPNEEALVYFGNYPKAGRYTLMIDGTDKRSLIIE